MPSQPSANLSHPGLYYLLPERRAKLTAIAKAKSYRLMNVELGQCATITSVLTELGRVLNFPTWYGINFDALNDCLTDPDWQPAPGHLVFIDGIAALHQGDPKGFFTLIEVLQAAAEERRLSGNPLWLIFDTAVRGIPPLSSHECL